MAGRKQDESIARVDVGGDPVDDACEIGEGRLAAEDLGDANLSIETAGRPLHAVGEGLGVLLGEVERRCEFLICVPVNADSQDVQVRPDLFGRLSELDRGACRQRREQVPTIVGDDFNGVVARIKG